MAGGHIRAVEHTNSTLNPTKSTSKLDVNNLAASAPAANHGVGVQSRDSVITPNPTPSQTPRGSPSRPCHLAGDTPPLDLLNLDFYQELQDADGSINVSSDNEVFTSDPHDSAFLRSSSSHDTTAPQEGPERDAWLRTLVPGTRDTAYDEGSPLTLPHRRRSWTNPQNQDTFLSGRPQRLPIYDPPILRVTLPRNSHTLPIYDPPILRPILPSSNPSPLDTPPPEMSRTEDFPALKATFLQQAYSLEFRISTIDIPENLSQQGFDTCRDAITEATTRLTALGDTYGTIRAHHPEQDCTSDGQQKCCIWFLSGFVCLFVWIEGSLFDTGIGLDLT